MKNLSRLLLLMMIFFFQAQANTVRISYTGGKQTGSFKIAGDAIQPAGGNPNSDTAIIDSNLLITNFIAGKTFSPTCAYEPLKQYGLFISSRSGQQGKLGITDTIWENTKTYPSNLFDLDSIPQPTYSSGKGLGINPKGLNIDTLYSNGECFTYSYRLIKGYNVIVYLKLNHGSGYLYGKLMIYGYDLAAPPNIGAWDDIKIAYTISDSTDINSGSVVGINNATYPNKFGANTFPTPQFFDPLGRHGVLDGPSRQFVPILRLSPKK